MPKSRKKGDNIWSLITMKQLVTAIASLDDRAHQLGQETWRLNHETKLSTSLWGEVIQKLKINDTEKMRHSLYNLLHSKRYKVKKLVREELRKENRNINDEGDVDMRELEEVSIEEDNNSNLAPDPSLPLPGRPNTRANKIKNINDNNTDHDVVSEISFLLTPAEWKIAFSCTQEKLNDGWKAIFIEKIKACGILCSLRFGNKHIKEGQRKYSCSYFWFCAVCSNSGCTRSYRAILLNKVDINTSPIFRLQIFGKEYHDASVETMSRHLTGEERLRVGERANQIGALAVFRERVEAADEKLIKAGNFTGCEAVETLKKAAADYRAKYKVDEDDFRECRIIGSAYLAADATSKTFAGYVQVSGEIPFREHLFCEPQIERYIQYCNKEKYSFVHIDATSGVMSKISDQSPPLLYAILFKDGSDPINNILLAHAILTDNTVPSITYFLGNVAHRITNYRGTLVLPSFFVIDFSAALMNSVLQAFPIEHIVTHLNRCWNVISGKYNDVQLRSSSFIHLCCCHVIHAIARSLTAARVDKKLRRGLLHIFAFILCGTDLEQLYDILGSLLNIFGNSDEQNAKEKFQDMLTLKLTADEESVTMLTDGEKIFEKAEKDDEFQFVDQYLRSNTAIIHQSPFNVEAIRRLGVYSPNIVEQIVHSFVPITDLCIASPNADICVYNSQSKTMNIFELATVMAFRDVVHTFSSYNRENVSRLIGDDITRVLLQHHPDEIINETKSMIHFMNDQFYYQQSNDKTITPVSVNNVVDSYSDIPRIRSTPAEIIIQQISSHKIDFDYLPSTDLKLFLRAIFSTFDTSYTLTNVQDSLKIFTQLIVGQSVYGLPYCSLDQQNPSLYQPCLVISTLFLRIPAHSVSTFSVYRLIPLPIIFNSDKYMYSNLPKIVGINSNDQTLVMWNDNLHINECMFSPIVLCQYKPVSMSLSKTSCLSQLLDGSEAGTSLCEVSRSNNIQQDVLHIADEFWLFYNVHHTAYCQAYSNINELPETIFIKEAAVVHVPCDKTITCPDFQLPIASCKENRVIVTPGSIIQSVNQASSIMPIKNMTQMILSSYHVQLDKSIEDLIPVFTSKQSKFSKTIRDLVMYIVSIVCCIFIMISLYIIKLIKYNLQKKMNHLDSQIQDIINF